MAQTFPIQLTSVLDLASLGINNQCFRFGTLTMESDRFVCIKDSISNPTSVHVLTIDLYNKNLLTKKPMKAEACLMNPIDNIMALKGKAVGKSGHFIQVFNLDDKKKLCVYDFDENVILWKWYDKDKLAIITETEVYHWNILSENSKPVKIFDRQGKLADSSTQLINYAVDSKELWCVLIGISTEDQGKTIDGSIQLYSVEKNQQQLLEGYAGCFSQLIIDDEEIPFSIFTFIEKKKDNPYKLHILDIYNRRKINDGNIFKVNSEVNFSSDLPNDFPISIHNSEKYGITYILTKGGYCYLFDTQTGTFLYKHRISTESIFLTCSTNKNIGGFLAVNRKGLIMKCIIDENNFLLFLLNNTNIINKNDISLSLAKRYGLPGMDEQLIKLFNQKFAIGEYKNAARIVAIMKSKILRTPQIIQQFKSAQNNPSGSGSQPSPILQYFSTLLEYDKLNKIETLELVKPVVIQGRKDFIEKWLLEDKLFYCDELGDLIKTIDNNLAENIYKKSGNISKILQSYVEANKYNEIIKYIQENRENIQQNSSNQSNNFMNILKSLIVHIHNTSGDKEIIASITKELLVDSDPPMIDVNQTIEVLLQYNLIKELTSVLLEYLKSNKPEHGVLQTRLLEINLLHVPQVAETIFQLDLFTHYDKNKIAILCEKARLYQRALENYTDISDIKRVMIYTAGTNLNSEWMLQFFSKLSSEISLEIINDLLKNNNRNQQILQILVQIAIKYHEQIGIEKLIDIFELYNSYEIIMHFLATIIPTNNSSIVHFKYIEAAAKLNQINEVERICKESQYYNPIQVKEFLKSSKLKDPRPLIYVCDLHNYLDEMTEYLYKNNLLKYLEVYVTKVNPSKTPIVIGSLLDLDCNEDYIKHLLINVRSSGGLNNITTGCNIEELVNELEKRNRLRILLPWLEARRDEGNNEVHLHNALAKIIIDTNNDPENFLINNKYYDSNVIGSYCEERDPHLAFIAYKRAWGLCDKQLIKLTNNNGLYRLQARYLVERQSLDLWKLVLEEQNKSPEDDIHKQAVIDQVVSNALPDSSNPEEVSCAVKAFIAAELPLKLIELLEKIVLHNSDFCNNKNLQNLLILTAVKADKTRVIDYINRLDNYDGAEIASIAINYNLYDEAYVLYEKLNMYEDAMSALILSEKNINKNNLERALDFAYKIDQPICWSKLGKAYLSNNNVLDAINCFIKGEDGTYYEDVINNINNNDIEKLIDYLYMCRKKIKEQIIDTELLYALATLKRYEDLEQFIINTNTADVKTIGDRLFDEEKYEAARIIYNSIPNNNKLALCFIQLNDFSSALDAAKKAKNPHTWKFLNYSALNRNDLKSAHSAALAVLEFPDHVDDIVTQYEKRMLIEELEQLLEEGMRDQRKAILSIHTELAIVYAKHDRNKLMDLLRNITLNNSNSSSSPKSLYSHSHSSSSYSKGGASSKLNIPKVIKVCEQYHLYKEAIFLYTVYDDYDSASNLVLQHFPSCFTHDTYLDYIQKVSNAELYYKSINFYLEYYPLQLTSFLKALEKKLDHSRVVQLVKNVGHISLIIPYLQSIQNLNISAVNEVLCDYFLQVEDHALLEDLVLDNNNLDQINLANKLNNHELRAMRRVAYLLYKNNKKYKQSIELSKKDGNFADAMLTARDSESPILVNDLLKYFLIERKDKELFAACLYVCYHYVMADYALELAWLHGCSDSIVPYFIQVIQQYSQRLENLEKKIEAKEGRFGNGEIDAGVGGQGEYGSIGIPHLALMPPSAPSSAAYNTTHINTSPFDSFSRPNGNGPTGQSPY